MRSSMKILVAAAATLLVAPQLAMGDDIEEQLRLMNERMVQLEGRLQATEGELQATQGELQATQDELQASTTTVAAQQELIEKAGLEREAQSGLSAFLSQTQFDGFLAASYTYNFVGTDVTRQEKDSGTLGGTVGGQRYPNLNRGALGLTAPLHPNNNTFQVDQLWFGMRKPATAESRAGWAVDLVWGVGADNIGTPRSAARNEWPAGDIEDYEDDDWWRADAQALGTGDLPHLFQAYAEYLAPIAGDVSIKLGRFQTLIGAEQFRQDQNFNVTRGLLWAIQPDNHTGVTVGSNYDNGVTWTVGVANSYSATMADSDHEKTFIGQLGYRGESFALLVNGLYGGNPSDIIPFTYNQAGIDGLDCFRPDSYAQGWDDCQGSDSDSVALIDLVATWDPTESISAWINFDYYWFNNAGGGGFLPWDNDRMNIYGISSGVRWGFLESTGFTVRFEWVRMEWHPFELYEDGDCCYSNGQDLNLFSVTGTLDHSLTDNLTLRVEGRYDWGKDNKYPDDIFTTARPNYYGDDFTRKDQGLGLVELMYRF